MDPERESPICSAMEHQGAMLGRHSEELASTKHVLEDLAAQVSDLTNQLHALCHD